MHVYRVMLGTQALVLAVCVCMCVCIQLGTQTLVVLAVCMYVCLRTAGNSGTSVGSMCMYVYVYVCDVHIIMCMYNMCVCMQSDVGNSGTSVGSVDSVDRQQFSAETQSLSK